MSAIPDRFSTQLEFHHSQYDAYQYIQHALHKYPQNLFDD
ncbi:16397_t:CDS:2 [Funneliformis geosporum]|uniref:16397_t:CDS:1 n=1 Tax=Funneliformis geosporum TaxID=1117311 RepID=A0A9W4SQ08_9GLOM|nr:16397_t:CDS:2 [Funneliformis geosporum]